MILHTESGLATGGVVWMHLTDMPGDMHPCGEAAFPLDGNPYALIEEIHENGPQALPSRDPDPERTFFTITPVTASSSSAVSSRATTWTSRPAVSRSVADVNEPSAASKA